MLKWTWEINMSALQSPTANLVWTVENLHRIYVVLPPVPEAPSQVSTTPVLWFVNCKSGFALIYLNHIYLWWLSYRINIICVSNSFSEPVRHGSLLFPDGLQYGKLDRNIPHFLQHVNSPDELTIPLSITLCISFLITASFTTLNLITFKIGCQREREKRKLYQWLHI